MGLDPAHPGQRCEIARIMVCLAWQRVGTKGHILQADLGKPLDFLADASFDIVLSTLALDSVEDWGRVFAEFYRVRRQPGFFIFSVGHPVADFVAHPEGNYFHAELIEYEYRGFGTPVCVPTYRRPLGALINPLLDAGFTVERLVEPTEAFRQTDPKDYAELSRPPGFLCVRAKK
jgi:SAM-dependent methyltransferase